MSRRRRLAVTLAVAALCAGCFVLRQRLASPGDTARITLGSEVILEIELSPDNDYVIGLREQYGVPVSFEVNGGAIRFIDVDCPDHICERAGFISADGQMAVCMPNRVAVIVSGQSDSD